MQFDSIRHRLLAIVVLFLVSMCLMIFTQVNNVNRLTQIQSHANTLTQLNVGLLQLRRLEKDFLLRQDLQYVADFEQQAYEFRGHLTAIRGIDTEYALEDTLLANLEQGFDEYRETFTRLVTLQEAIGLDEASGHQGKFRDAAHMLEQRLAAHKQDAFSVRLLQLRRYEKDFMLRRELRYEMLHARAYELLRGDLTSVDTPFEADNLRLLDQYRADFRQMVDTTLNMGLDEDSGLQAEFRTSARAVEGQLAGIIAALTPLIAERQSRVRQSGVVIMVLTAVILAGILLHSFLQLTRAFSTLIMYFYRCKRQFELLDQRKIHFSEFRTLAEVVNEMMQAKQDAEVDLKEVQTQLATFQDVGESSGAVGSAESEELKATVARDGVLVVDGSKSGDSSEYDPALSRSRRVAAPVLASDPAPMIGRPKAIVPMASETSNALMATPPEQGMDPVAELPETAQGSDIQPGREESTDNDSRREFQQVTTVRMLNRDKPVPEDPQEEADSSNPAADGQEHPQIETRSNRPDEGEMGQDTQNGTDESDVVQIAGNPIPAQRAPVEDEVPGLSENETTRAATTATHSTGEPLLPDPMVPGSESAESKTVDPGDESVVLAIDNTASDVPDQAADIEEADSPASTDKKPMIAGSEPLLNDVAPEDSEWELNEVEADILESTLGEENPEPVADDAPPEDLDLDAAEAVSGEANGFALDVDELYGFEIGVVNDDGPDANSPDADMKGDETDDTPPDQRRPDPTKDA